MLTKLHIQNYALIDQLSVEWGSGLTIITGETGAGKSILLGALSLLLGQRADHQTLKDSAQKCVVEGSFAIERYGLDRFFEQYDLDYEPLTIIRREITPAGKSRAFVNDTPVNLAQLRELSTALVDIHSQHQTLQLGQSTFQLQVLDAFAGHADEVREVGNLFRQYKNTASTLEALREKARAARKERDYDEFLWGELDEARLQDGEEDSLQAELDTLSNAEDIQVRLGQVVQGLVNGDETPGSILQTIIQLLEPIGRYHTSLAEQVKRLKSVAIELDDISADLESLQGGIEHDPERLGQVESRLDLINRLLHKHGVMGTRELLGIRDVLQGKLGGMESQEEEIKELERQLGVQQQQLEKRASALTKTRTANAPRLEKEVNTLLAELGMPQAHIKVQISPREAITASGGDDVAILFTANKGRTPQALARIASGGELSRVMLALKAVLAQKTALPTIIFDEIDTGVSGDVAGKVGRILHDMGQQMQVVSITHLPQIAGRGAHHLRVRKETVDNRTVTRIEPLAAEERLHEVARMLSGEKMTQAALDNARELLRT